MAFTWPVKMMSPFFLVRFQAGGGDAQGDFPALLLGGGALRRGGIGPEQGQKPGEG